MKPIKEIESLVKAKYELIYVNTFEEVRVVDEVLQLAKNLNMNLGVWTFASGLKAIQVDSSGNAIEIPDKQDFSGNPLAILNHIREAKNNAIYILKDYHTFLKDAEAVRMLKDTIQAMKSSYTPIIITAPVVKLPVEIEKDTTVVDYTLPEDDQIQEIIDLILESRPEVTLTDEQNTQVLRACLGLTATEIEDILSRSVIDSGTLDPGIILSQKKQIIRKNGLLEYVDTIETIENIGGITNLKQWLNQRKLSFSEEARKFGLPMSKGLILTGVQGCGKSLVCKAASNMMNMPLLKLDMGSVMQSLVGSSEENIRNVLKVAEAVAPCILWIDEIEKGLSGVASSNFSDGGTTSRVFAYLLTWLQDRKRPVFVLATANDLTMLSPELLRAGRFDDMFFVDLPGAYEREEIFKIHLSKRNRDPKKFNLKELAAESEGYSGAEIEQSIIDAMFDVFVKDAGTADIGTPNIVTALKKRIPLSVVKKEQIKKLREKASEIAKPAS